MLKDKTAIKLVCRLTDCRYNIDGGFCKLDRIIIGKGNKCLDYHP